MFKIPRWYSKREIYNRTQNMTYYIWIHTDKSCPILTEKRPKGTLFVCIQD